MKKFSLVFLLLITCLFAFLGCSCDKKETVKREAAISILKETKVDENVKIITTTETNVNGVKTTSNQTDIYYNDKYYHLTENNGVTTKTWYGEINNILYAFRC